jgi:hypothetical protein
MRGLTLALLLGLAGQPLLAEVDAVAFAAKIARYWNVGIADAETRASRIVVQVSFARDGTPVEFKLIEARGRTKAGVDQLFDVALRAVKRAHLDGGLPLSAADYDNWRVIDLVFDANGMTPSS